MLFVKHDIQEDHIAHQIYSANSNYSVRVGWAIRDHTRQ